VALPKVRAVRLGLARRRTAGGLECGAWQGSTGDAVSRFVRRETMADRMSAREAATRRALGSRRRHRADTGGRNDPCDHAGSLSAKRAATDTAFAA